MLGSLCRLLQISSFNGKMNALNEVNKVITNVSYYTHRHSQLEEDEWLTAEKMAVSRSMNPVFPMCFIPCVTQLCAVLIRNGFSRTMCFPLC